MAELQLGNIKPAGADNIVVDGKYVRGGFVVVADTYERDALKGDNGKNIIEGSLCYCQADGKFYQYDDVAKEWILKDFATKSEITDLSSLTSLQLTSSDESSRLNLDSSGSIRYTSGETNPELNISVPNSTGNGSVVVENNLRVNGEFSNASDVTAIFNGPTYVRELRLGGRADNAHVSTEYDETISNYRLTVNGYRVLYEGDDYSGSGVDDDLLNTETLRIQSYESNTIGTELTTIATIDGIDIKTKIAKPTITQSQYTETVGTDLPVLLGASTTQNINLSGVSVKTGTSGITANPVNGQIKAGSFYAWSDKRLKQNIEDYSCEKSILDLPVKKYEFINSPGKTHIGCIAQDLQEICPEIINTDKEGYLSINESKIVYLLLDEVKKLKEETNGLRKEVAELKKIKF